jgi:hypothetical protein
VVLHFQGLNAVPPLQRLDGSLNIFRLLAITPKLRRMERISGFFQAVKSYLWSSASTNVDAAEDANSLVDLEPLFRSAHSLGGLVEDLAEDIILEIIQHLGWREIVLLSFSTKRLHGNIESVRSTTLEKR